jgi:hypothetical protein
MHILSLGFVSDGKNFIMWTFSKPKIIHKENLPYHNYKICHEDWFIWNNAINLIH